MALTQAQVKIVKATAPILKQHGKTITSTMYRNMLGANPDMRNIFSLRSQVTGEQPEALARSVLAYATYIDDLGKLSHAVERIAQKHVSLYIQPEQYDIVGKHLVGAFGEVLGDALTDEIKAAWVAAYGQLAGVFINREAALYEKNPEWKTWRKFKIARKEADNESVTSFYFEPVDGKPLPQFLPGQYVSVQIPLPGFDFNQSRQFSLSEKPTADGKYYRISVKREATIENAPREDIGAGKVPGIISNLLHNNYNVGDEVELSAPAGEFFLDPTKTDDAAKPLVLMSLGVGATPLRSIHDAVLESETANRPITWLHGARNSGSVCFADHARQSAAAHDNVTTKIFLKDLREGDIEGTTYDFTGRFNLEKLEQEGLLQLDKPDAEYYLCGPEEWMVETRDWLTAKGVSWSRQHLELFKTGDVPQ